MSDISTRERPLEDPAWLSAISSASRRAARRYLEDLQ
jgi:hypothetical protein